MEGLLRGMLPKGWDCKDDNPYGIKCGEFQINDDGNEKLQKTIIIGLILCLELCREERKLRGRVKRLY